MTGILQRLAALTPEQPAPLPCPFCGTPPEENRYEGKSFGPQFQVECQNVDCTVEVGTCAYGSIEQARANWNTRARETALIALVQEAAAEIERLRKLAAESRDVLDAAIPCIGRDSSSFSTQYTLQQVKEQRERCEEALNPQESPHG